MSHGDLRRRTLHSLFWQFLGVGGQRVVQLLSPIVLSKLLPEGEIGLFVTVYAGIGVIEALTAFLGEQSSIASSRGAERDYLDTVFTVRLLRGLGICALLCALAPVFAWYFDKPQYEGRYWLEGMFLLMAGNGLVDALQSPARAARMKGMQFRRVALGDFVATVLGIGVTLALAYAWRDVWAMLVGQVCSSAIRTAMSYVSAPHRPRWHLDRSVLKELLHYSTGAAGTPFLLLMIFSAPTFVLNKLAGDAAVAVFDFAGKLAKLPEDIFLRVLAPVAVPAYAQLKHDTPRLARAWLGAVHTFLQVGTPMTLTLAWCGNALPEAVFGPRYGEIGGLFALLALHGGIAGLTAVIGPLFWAVGQPQWDRRAQFCRCVAIYGFGIPAAYWGGSIGFAGAACLAIATALLVSLRHALPLLGLCMRDLAKAATGGLVIGLGLGAALLAIELMLAPVGWWRIGAGALTGGPLLGFLLLRLLRNRHGTPTPTTPPPSEPADVLV